MKTKYIVYDSVLSAEMIIFGNTLQHADVADQMRVKHLIISAGFLSVGTNAKGFTQVEAFGNSISLDVKSNEEFDSALAKKVLDI